MARPTIGHLDPAFVGLMDDIKRLLQMAFRTENALTMPVSAPGSAGMEACLVNLVEAGETVVIAQNGVFAGRMRAIVERIGATPITVEGEWGRAVDVDAVRAALAANPATTVLAFVHAETSTGASSDAAALAALAREHECLTVVDAVTSLGGSPLEVDAWGLDAVYSGSQKCLSCTPGLSPITMSERAVERIRGRKTAVPSWFLDLNLVMGYWGAGSKRSYHHTAPVNALYGLHESLRILEDEGVPEAWERHRMHHRALAAGLDALGLEIVPPPDERLPQLNCVRVPGAIDEAKARRRLLEEYGLEIGGGLGPLAGKVWRIGLMGHASRRANVITALGAIEGVLGLRGGAGVGAALEAYA
jgi:alanine-glyoxylate transaminase/serine-glyoxylate transaminase/serine-pyruvate transaminase